MSLISVMVASAIVGALVIAISTTVMWAQKSMSHVGQKADFESVAQEVKVMTGNSEYCSLVFKDVAFIKQSLEFDALEINYGGEGIRNFVEVGTRQSGLEIKTIRLEKVTPPDPPQPVWSNNCPGLKCRKRYSTRLRIVANLGGESGGLRPKEVPLYVDLDGAENIVNCFGVFSEKGMCEMSLGGYYESHPAMGKPNCQTYFEQEYKDGVVKYSKSQYFKAGSLEGTGEVKNILGLMEVEAKAPKCPPGTRPVDCRIRMETAAGHSETWTNTFNDWDSLLRHSGMGSRPSWSMAYFDHKDTYKDPFDNTEKPYCKLRSYGMGGEGAWTTYAPVVVCAASHFEMLTAP